jgi:hypothetical protein
VRQGDGLQDLVNGVDSPQTEPHLDLAFLQGHDGPPEHRRHGYRGDSELDCEEVCRGRRRDHASDQEERRAPESRDGDQQ